MKRLAAIAAIAMIILGLFVASMARQKKHLSPSIPEIQARQGIPVRTSELTMGDISDTLEVTGDIKALRTAALSAKIMGKVVWVSGREGDPVQAGQVVVRLDQEDGLAAVQQARAGLDSAIARLSQAETAARVQKTQSSASIEQAQAALTAARAQLAIVKKGARRQERLIAESAVTTAKANLDNAEANFRRQRQLHEQGAISPAQLDVARTQYEVAKAQYESAKQQLSLVREGAREEEIRQAETQVRQAEEALRMAKANAAQNELRREEVKAARAGISQAKAALKMAEQQLANTYVKSPISGYISRRMTEPGQQAAPGVPLMEVVDVSTVYFEAEISETSLARVRSRQPVNVRVDAFEGRIFAGQVERIFPMGSERGRKFQARISIPNPRGELRPGMFARGSIELVEHIDVLLAPRDAVLVRNGKALVFTVEKGRAISHEVRLGLGNGEVVELVSPKDLEPGKRVVVSGQDRLRDGTRVYVAD